MFNDVQRCLMVFHGVSWCFMVFDDDDEDDDDDDGDDDDDDVQSVF